MANVPYECPIPNDRACPHTSTIVNSQTQMAVIIDRLGEIKEDLKSLKIGVSHIATLEQNAATHKEALGRAFDEIKAVAEKVEEHAGIIQQFEGMKKLAMVLWTVLASGVGVVLLKVFSL